jgi:tetratricopeptide (TPR) repeat protein
MKKLIAATASLSLVILIIACAKDYRSVISAPEEKFYRGQEYDAAKMLLPYNNKAGKDQLLFMMEAGYLLHMAGKYEDSNKVFLQAAKIAQVVPISVSREVGALLSNQTVTNYRGEDFEKVLVHMYLGINYLMLKNYEDAAVEFKAVNNELNKIKTENGKARYKQNIMAKYLTAIAHELRAGVTGSEDDQEYAEVEYKQILQLKPDLQMARSDLMQVQTSKNSNLGELVVIFQAGRTPIKVSRGKLLEDPGMNMAVGTALSTQSLAAGVTVGAIMTTIGVAENPIPKFKIRTNKTKCLRVYVLGQQATTEMLESIEYTALKNMDDDYGRLRGKVAASIVIKAIVSIAAGIAAEETTRKLSKGNTGLSSLVGLMVGAGTGTALFATIRPDLRCWHTLPANLQLARMRLAPGKYTATVQYIGYNGAVQNAKQLNFEVKKKEKYFINIRTVE